MQRLKETYLETIQAIIPFAGKRLLEIGCGDGARTIQIADCCKEVVAIDPDPALIAKARSLRSKDNIRYQEGSGDALPFDDASFDIVFFTLSFHHIPVDRMTAAIDASLRVLEPSGFIIFLEPAFTGSFFEAEIRFDACDGDERKEKAFAYATMLAHPRLKEIAERSDETIFQFDSPEDFIAFMKPHKSSTEEIHSFLASNNNQLSAKRRINLFQRVIASASQF